MHVGFSTATDETAALKAEVEGKYTNDCRNNFLENDYVSTLGCRHYLVKILFYDNCRNPRALMAGANFHCQYVTDT